MRYVNFYCVFLTIRLKIGKLLERIRMIIFESLKTIIQILNILYWYFLAGFLYKLDWNKKHNHPSVVCNPGLFSRNRYMTIEHRILLYLLFFVSIKMWFNWPSKKSEATHMWVNYSGFEIHDIPKLSKNGMRLDIGLRFRILPIVKCSLFLRLNIRTMRSLE